MSFWEDWIRRWRKHPFFRGMDRLFEDAFGELSRDLPKELFRERKLPDGSTVRTFGPVVHGYSMAIGPDGVPVIREFGNIRPGLKPGVEVPRPAEAREPLVDVIPGPKIIRVIAELPGVEKSDIDLGVEEDKMTISVDTEERKYQKEIDLPAKVDSKSADATYHNGVLEVILRKIEERKKGERVNIK